MDKRQEQLDGYSSASEGKSTGASVEKSLFPTCCDNNCTEKSYNPKIYDKDIFFLNPTLKF